MAFFSFRIKTVSRRGGRSVVAASAYRAAERLKEYEQKKEQAREQQRKQNVKQRIDDVLKAASYRSGEKIKDKEKSITHDYRKKQHIAHTEIILPENAPKRLKDREKLWNEVNEVEKYKNARLAREVMVVLHRELDMEQNKKLVKDFIKENFTNRGMIADLAIHNPPASDGKKNPHAHILLTTREVNKDGFLKTKNREWNQNKVAEGWRKSWADNSNQKLKEAGHKIKIDHRSYEERGIQKVPGIHLGKSATAMENQGIKTERGERLRKIEVKNAVLQSIRLTNSPKYQKELEQQRIIQISRQHIGQKRSKGISR